MRQRSFLFTPASRLDRLEKARKSGADRVVIDLEDGVGTEEKGQARAAVQSLLKDLGDDAARALALRINALSTSDGIRDMHALLECGRWPGMLVLPKVESSREIVQIRSIARELGRSPILMVILETAIGIDQATRILRGCGSDTLVGYGSADHTAETRGSMGAAALAWARGHIINACAAARLPAVDGVFLDYRDTDGLKQEARLVRELGFSGKIAIHPSQIATINAAFTPTKADAELARAMIEAARTARSGAFSFNGKMVDEPVLAQARRTLQAYQEDL